MSLLFLGDYANPDTPLWLSAGYNPGPGPTPGPTNLVVSTLTVGYEGGIVMTQNPGLPQGQGAQLTFERYSSPSSNDTQLLQNYGDSIPGKPPITYQYLTVATDNANVFDDLAVAGVQIYGDQLLNRAMNTPRGYIAGTVGGSDITAYTGAFRTENLIASTLSISSFVLPEVFVFSSIQASSIFGENIVASTFNISSLVLPTNLEFSSITASSIDTLYLNVQEDFTGYSGNFNFFNVGTLGVPISANIEELATDKTFASTLVASTISTNYISAGIITASTLSSISYIDTDVIESNRINATSTMTSPFIQFVSSIGQAMTVSSISTNNISSGNIQTSSINAFSIIGNNITASNTVSGQSGNFTQGNYQSMNVSGNLNVASNLSTTNLRVFNNATILNLSTGNVSSGTINAGVLNSVTGNISSLNASTIAASTINVSSLGATLIRASTIDGTIGSFSTLTYSTLIGTPNTNFSTLGISSLTTNNTSSIYTNTTTIGAGTGFFSSLNFSTITGPSFQTSTINVSTLQANNFSVVNPVSTLVVSTFSSLTANINLANVSTVSSINLNSKNFKAQNIDASTMSTISMTTQYGLFNNLKFAPAVFDSFTSGINMNLDGAITGLVGPYLTSGLRTLVGGVGANIAINTGFAALGLARQNGSGGVYSNVFSLVNTTTQLQYSTVGQYMSSTQLFTDSAQPGNVPGNQISTTRYIMPGTYCMRSMSDPLNPPSQYGASNQYVQAFGEWEPVYSGTTQVLGTRLTTIWDGQPATSFIDLGTSIYGAPIASSIIIQQGSLVPPGIVTPTIISTPQLVVNLSPVSFPQNTLRVVGGNIVVNDAYGFVQADNFKAAISTITPTLNATTVSSQTTTADSFSGNVSFVSSIGYNILAPKIAFNNNTITMPTSNVTISSLIVSTISIRSATISTLNVSTTQTSGQAISTLSVSTINGTAIPTPFNLAQPTGSLMIWPCGSFFTGPANVPPGYLLCDGSIQSSSAYPNLFAVIGYTWGGSGGSFNLPDATGRIPMGTLTSSDSVFLPQVQATTVTGNGLVDINNAWIVYQCDGPVYLGMNYNFGGTTGSKQIQKILSYKLVDLGESTGNGFVCPFIVLWSLNTNSGAVETFPATSGSATLTPISTTLAPRIGAGINSYAYENPLRNLLGVYNIAQGTDQVGKHTHNYNIPGLQTAAGATITAGSPNIATATSQPSGVYSFVSSGTFTAVNTMPVVPPNFGVFYYIKT